MVQKHSEEHGVISCLVVVAQVQYIVRIPDQHPTGAGDVAALLGAADDAQGCRRELAHHGLATSLSHGLLYR